MILASRYIIENFSCLRSIVVKYGQWSKLSQKFLVVWMRSYSCEWRFPATLLILWCLQLWSNLLRGKIATVTQNHKTYVSLRPCNFRPLLTYLFVPTSYLCKPINEEEKKNMLGYVQVSLGSLIYRLLWVSNLVWGWPCPNVHMWDFLHKYTFPYPIWVIFKLILALSKIGIQCNHNLHKMIFPECSFIISQIKDHITFHPHQPSIYIIQTIP